MGFGVVFNSSNAQKTNKNSIIARRAYCVGGSLKMMCVCVRVSVSLYVCVSCVAIENNQVLNGKTSLSKVSDSKRDPKKVHIDDLIARFWDVDEISGIHCNWRIIWLNDVFRIIETWRDDNRERHTICPSGDYAPHVLSSIRMFFWFPKSLDFWYLRSVTHLWWIL